MAFTLAHPLAAVALRPLCRRGWLHFPALVAGSVAPDVGYLLGRMEFSDAAHTATGALTHAFPAAFLILSIFYLLRVPVFFTIPCPFRHFLMHCPSVRKAPTDPTALTKACLSLLAGIVAHLLWDSFTQTDGWLVKSMPVLREPISIGSGFPLPLYTLLYHLTTGLGFLGLAFFSGRWLTARLRLLGSWRGRYEGWRWYFWCLILAVPAVYALAANWKHTAGSPHYLRYKWFSQNFLVDFVTMFITSLAMASCMVYAAHRLRPPDSGDAGPGRVHEKEP